MPWQNNQNGGNNGGYQKKPAYGGSAPRSSAVESVTTTGIGFLNENAGKFMNFNYWGRNVSIEIGTCPAGQPFNWEARKGAQMFKQVISFTSLSDLATMCDEVYESLKSNGTFTSVGIRVGSKRDSILEISNGENLKMPMGIYLVVYKGLDSNNCTTVLEFYPFDGSRFIRGYDHVTGMAKEDFSKMGEFKKFRRAVNAAADAFTMAQAHAIAELKKTDKLTTFKALAAVGAALGVDMTKDLMEKKTTGTTTYTRNQNPPSGGYQKKSSYGGGGFQRGSYNAPRNGGFQKPQQVTTGTFEPSNTTNYQQALNAMNDEPVDINLDVSQLQNVSLSDFGG